MVDEGMLFDPAGRGRGKIFKIIAKKSDNDNGIKTNWKYFFSEVRKKIEFPKNITIAIKQVGFTKLACFFIG